MFKSERNMHGNIEGIFYNYCICLNKNNTEYEVSYIKGENVFRVVMNVDLVSDALCNRGSPIISYNVNRQAIYTIKCDNSDTSLYDYLNGIYYIINDINPKDDITGIFDKYNFYLKLNYFPYGLIKLEYDGLYDISIHINDEYIKKNIQLYGINCDKVTKSNKDIHFKYSDDLPLEENLYNFSKLIYENKVYEINNELSIVSDPDKNHSLNNICAGFENNILYYLHKGDSYIKKDEIVNELDYLSKKDVVKLALILNSVYNRIIIMDCYDSAFKSLLNIMLFIDNGKSVLEKKLLFILEDGLWRINNDEININALMLAEHWGGWRSLLAVNKYIRNATQSYSNIDYILSYGRNVLNTLLSLQSNLNINDLNDIISTYNNSMSDNDNLYDVFWQLYKRYRDNFLCLLIEGYNECKECDEGNKLIDGYLCIMKFFSQNDNIKNNLLDNIIGKDS